MGMEKQNQAHGTQDRDKDQESDVFIHGGTTLLGVSAQGAVMFCPANLRAFAPGFRSASRSPGRRTCRTAKRDAC
jgi:hypothetical protein